MAPRSNLTNEYGVAFENEEVEEEEVEEVDEEEEDDDVFRLTVIISPADTDETVAKEGDENEVEVEKVCVS